MITVVVAEQQRKIWAYALQNALSYGNAKPEVVLNKVISFYKKPIDELRREVEDVCSKVNSLPKDEAQKLFEDLKNEIASPQKPQHPKKLLDAPGAVTRFLPEPNGYLHIGHAKAMLLSYTVAKENNGHFFLRFDDTNPEKEKQEYVDAIKKDMKWLGVEYEKEVYTSDFMEDLYNFAEVLIKNGDAYVCTCSQEEIKANRKDKKECKCRARSIEENLSMFEKLKKGEGPGVLRLKGDMKSENTVMRDPTLMRIKTAPHFRKGDLYKLYPTYDFEAPIVDSITGVTHAIRSKEYELRDELYYYILDRLKLRKPKIIDIGRLEIRGGLTSKRKINQLIKEGKLSGFDDVRLLTLAALRRRGILPEAIKSFVLSFGISKTEAKAEIELLLSQNRKIVDPIARRFFFAPDPVAVNVANISPGKLTLKNHPSQQMGEREVIYTSRIYIPGREAKDLGEGDVVKLKDFADIRILKIGGEIEAEAVHKTGQSEQEGRGQPKKIIQWVSEPNIKIEVWVPKSLIKEDGTYNEQSLEKVYGVAEQAISSLKEGDIIQFERFGFCSLLDKSKNIFVFSC